MKSFLSYSKPIATWLVAWMVVFSVPAFALTNTHATAIEEAANEGAHAEGKAMRPCSEVPFANLLADPVARDWQPDPKEYKILTLTEESCGKMQTGSGKTIRTRLRKGMSIAVPLNGAEDFRVVACGNPYVPEGALLGKYFECQVCPPPTPAATVQPGLTRADLEEFYSRLERTTKREESYVPPPNDNRWFCARHPYVCSFVGLGIIVGGAAAFGGRKKSCDTCGCPTCPPRKKPG